ncbi:MAG: hypothetical protein ACPHJ3_01205, partial [Rubripirellula sp.]
MAFSAAFSASLALIASPLALYSASATSAAGKVDEIEGFYLGAATTDPTTDQNGDPLTSGDFYFNT